LTHPTEVVHNAAARRFEAVVGGLLCRADYLLVGDTMRLFHTEVPPALEGRGIASVLVRAAFDHAAANGLKIAPACSYVSAWVRRHREFANLVAP
jgi:predicted GNAT family acetyltransferase